MTGIDLEKMRLSQEFDGDYAGEEVIDQIRIKKPSKQAWFRAHPDKSMRIETKLLYLDEEASWFYVQPEIWPYLADDLTRVTLVTCINLSQEVFLWPVKLPSVDGRKNSWITSALNAADTAMNHWTRIVSDMGRGKYRILKAKSISSEPNWPEHSLQDLVDLAFAESQIKEKDHPIVKKLRGLT